MALWGLVGRSEREGGGGGGGVVEARIEISEISANISCIGEYRHDISLQ